MSFTEQFKVLLVSLKNNQNNLGAEGARGKEEESEDCAKKFETTALILN